MKRFIYTFLFLISTFPAFCAIYLDSLLSDGLSEKPHQLYSYKERRFFNLPYNDASWVIDNGGESDVIDNYAFWGLLYNDFYIYYHNAKIDLSSPLKKKMFEQSEDYNSFLDDMQTSRNRILCDTIHFPLDGVLGYVHEYDVTKGGFSLSSDLPNEFPDFPPQSKSIRRLNTQVSLSHESDNGCKYAVLSSSSNNNIPRDLTISQSIRKQFSRVSGRKIQFFVPISNLDVAVDIENSVSGENVPKDDNYQFLCRVKYCNEPHSIMEIVDIILFKTSNRQVVWSMTLGDLSDSLK